MIKHTLALTAAIVGYFLFFNISHGQISETEVIETIPSKPEVKKHLTKNFLGGFYKDYFGQILYVNGKRFSPERGYEDFFTDEKLSKTYKPVKEGAVIPASKYEKLHKRYFQVTDIQSVFRKIRFKLKDKKTKETIYFSYDPKYKHNFPFIVASYVDYLSDLYVGKPLVINNMQTKNLTPLDGVTEGFSPTEHQWKGHEVTVDNKSFYLSLVVVNKEGRKAISPIFCLISETRGTALFTKDKAQQYEKRFGKENWEAILASEIKIGFSEEMTKLSWGNPEKINRASYSDQWCYRNNTYLYFKKGKLTSFN